MSSKRTFSRVAAGLVLAAFLPLSAACFGGYNLTRNLYKWNANVSDNKWIVWLIHIPMTLVFGFTAAADGAIFNSVEFWSGENPINLSDARTIHGPNGEVAHVTPLGDDRAHVVVRETEGVTREATLVRDANGVSAFDAEGRLIAFRAL